MHMTRETMKEKQKGRKVDYCLCEVDKPTTIQEVKSSDHATKWKVAAESEYNWLIVNKIWKLVE